MSMNIALCHESVLPQRGGCETYVASLARRLAADGHEVHLYARYWEAAALPPGLQGVFVWRGKEQPLRGGANRIGGKD